MIAKLADHTECRIEQWYRATLGGDVQVKNGNVYVFLDDEDVEMTSARHFECLDHNVQLDVAEYEVM